MKKIVVGTAVVAAVIIVGSITAMNMQETEETVVTREEGQVSVPSTTNQQTVGKLKVENFYGKLDEVTVSCFVDGICYAIVNGKKIELRGGGVTIVQDPEGGMTEDEIRDLREHEGEGVEVYARDMGDGTYSLYGSDGFYVKVK